MEEFKNECLLVKLVNQAIKFSYEFDLDNSVNLCFFSIKYT